jgi:2-polyprenyl-6-methoxyphenol hydroxylase-like FAD-dependent oxidoreductase
VTARTHEVDVCIAGGGPAGLTLALLLAKSGVRALVLEQNPDFQREYRGEVLMPRFMRAFDQVGLLPVIAGKPQQRLDRVFIDYRDKPLTAIRIDRVDPEFPHALWMPQPVMLEALHEAGAKLPAYDLWFRASARELIREGGRVTGVVVRRGAEHVNVTARVVVAADGRYSHLRKEAGFELELDRTDFDVVWFDLPRPPGHDATVRAWFTSRRNYLVLPKYPDLVQCGIIVEPGGLGHYRAKGLESLRADLLAGPSFFHEFARALTDFSPFTPLDAKMALAREWAKDGMLLIGDSAHTCSPAGAIGVSVAVETAIVAAHVLRKSIASGDVSAAALSEVEKLRIRDVRAILSTQQRVAVALVAPRRWSLPFMVVAVRLAGRLGILPRLFRNLATRRTPLPVPADVRFG